MNDISENTVVGIGISVATTVIADGDEGVL